MLKITQLKFEQMKPTLDIFNLPYDNTQHGKVNTTAFIPEVNIPIKEIYNDIKDKVPFDKISLKYRQPLCVIVDIDEGRYYSEYNISHSKVYTVREVIRLVRNEKNHSMKSDEINNAIIDKSLITEYKFRDNLVYAATGKELIDNLSIVLVTGGTSQTTPLLHSGEIYLPIKETFDIIGEPAGRTSIYNNINDDNIIRIFGIDIHVVKTNSVRSKVRCITTYRFNKNQVNLARKNKVKFINRKDFPIFNNLSNCHKGFVTTITNLKYDRAAIQYRAKYIGKEYITTILEVIDLIKKPMEVRLNYTLKLIKASNIEYVTGPEAGTLIGSLTSINAIVLIGDKLTFNNVKLLKGDITKNSVRTSFLLKVIKKKLKKTIHMDNK